MSSIILTNKILLLTERQLTVPERLCLSKYSLQIHDFNDQNLMTPISEILNSFMVLIIDIRKSDFFQYYQDNFVHVPNTVSTIFLKRSGNNLMNSEEIKQNLHIQYIRKSLPVIFNNQEQFLKTICTDTISHKILSPSLIARILKKIISIFLKM